MNRRAKKICFAVLIVALLGICSGIGYVLKHKYFPTIAIYEVYHKEYKIFRSDAVIPIQAGRVLKRDYGLVLETQMIGDDTGDNISYKNARFAELTAMYWVWKNVHGVDYVGLMHYRRHFVNPRKDNDCDRRNLMCRDGLTQKALRPLFEKYDIIIPRVNPQPGMTVYQQYYFYHYKEDIDMALDYIRERYPEMKRSIEEGFINTRYGYFNNLFIMRRDIFDKYAAWLFDILFALEDKLDPKLQPYKTLGYRGETADNYQERVEGFLAERLFTIWLYHNRHEYNVLELPKIVLSQEKYEE